MLSLEKSCLLTGHAAIPQRLGGTAGIPAVRGRGAAGPAPGAVQDVELRRRVCFCVAAAVGPAHTEQLVI